MFELLRRTAPPEVKASRAQSLIALATAGRPQWTPRDYASLAREGFARNPIVYRCVRLLAEATASVPLIVYDQGVRAADHPVARLLARPNREQAGADLIEAFVGALQISGNGYIEAAGGDEGDPCELYALRPDRMAVVPGRQGWPMAYDYSANGQTSRIPADASGWLPVMHLKLFNPVDDYYGASPLEAAAFAIDVHNASGAWNKALLDNAARPSGALVYRAQDGADRLSPQQFEDLKTQLAEAHIGSANAGRPLVLDGGLEWQSMSLSPAEMDFAAGKHAAAREIALAFGVPPQLLGIPGDNTYANYREANVAFWRQSVVPLAERIARALGNWLGRKYPGLGIGCDLEGVPALSAERETLWTRLEAASFLTLEERRRLAGLDHG